MTKTWRNFEGIHKIPQTGGVGSQFFPNWGRDKKEIFTNLKPINSQR